MNYNSKQSSRLAALVAMAVLTLSTQAVRSQTAYFTNLNGGDWNTAANWNVDFSGFSAVPGSGTNADIGSLASAAVTYNTPMTAPNILSLSVLAGASLDVNAGGFNVDGQNFGLAPLTVGGALNVNSAGVLTSLNAGPAVISAGGVVNVSGKALIAPMPGVVPLSVDSAAFLNVNDGGTLTLADGTASTVGSGGKIQITGGSLVFSNSAAMSLLTGSALQLDGGSLIGTNNPSGEFTWGQNTSSDANAGVAVTNNGGTIILDRLVRIRSRDTRFTMNGGYLDLQGGLAHDCGGNDSRQWFLINGGTAFLHDVTINRASTSGGLRIENGVVTTTSTRIGIGVAAGYAIMTGGLWTNQGALYVADRNNAADSGSRRVFLRIDGGELVTEGPEGIVINNQGEATTANLSNVGGELDMNGGTVTAEGIQLNGPSVTANALARLNVSGGTIYLGSAGLVANVNPANSLTASIILSGGTFGAKADWSSSADLPLSGTLNFLAADAAGSPHNITLSGILSGSGGINKTGAGVLTLNGANTYSGSTTITEGTLALGGTLATPVIVVGSDGTFDVSSAVSYTLGATKSIEGVGTVSGGLVAGSGALIKPAGDGATGVLTFTGGLTQLGGVINNLEISAVTNDIIDIVGDLTLNPADTNLISVSSTGGGIAAGTYVLIRYTGVLNGSLDSLALLGVPGTLIHDSVAKTISVTTSGVRAPAMISWVGAGGGGDWDILTSLNWNDGSPSAYFVNGDDVRFDSLGAANPAVHIPGPVSPSSVTVDAAADYTFSGAGDIGGTGGLTKTNSGVLTVQTTNSYSGPTVIGGGTLVASLIANAGFSSSIGAAGTDPSNLIVDGGTLRFVGDAGATTRGATFNPGGATLAIPGALSVLALNGAVTGSGALVKDGPGQLTLGGANSYAGGTVVSNGVLQLGAATSAGSGAISLRSGATLRIAGAYTMTNNIEVDGVVTVDLNNNSPSGDRHLVGAWSGNATINIANMSDIGRTFTMGGLGGMDTLSGVVNLGSSSMRFRFNHDDSSPNTGSANVQFKLGSGNVILEPRNGNVTVELGSLEGGPATTIRGRASGVSGTVTYAIGGLNLSTVFDGSISNSPSGNLTSIRKVGNGKLTLTGNAGYTGSTAVEAGTLQVDGLLGNTAVSVMAGTLSGGGTLEGFVNVMFGATFSPGNGVGTMTINNTLQLDFGSTNIMEIDKAGGVNDSVIGLTSVSFGGVLIVTNVGGAFSPGDTFTLYSSAGGYGGAFESIVLPPLGNGMTWNTDNLLVDGTISVVGVAAPQVSVTRMNGNLILSGSGEAGATYYVLSSTNLATPLASWTAVETNVFDVNGAFSYTNSIDSATPHRFFILSVE